MWDRPKFAQPGQFPHQVSIQWSLRQGSPYIHSCSGAILSEYWVITSAYCIFHIPAKSFKIKAGCHNISNTDEYTQTTGAERTIIYDKYTKLVELRDLMPYDLGLIKLQPAFIFNNRVHSIKLPRINNWFSHSYKLNYNMILSGWGSIGYTFHNANMDIMRTVNLPVVPNKVCMDSIATVNRRIELYDTQMCTRPLDGSLSACIADNGAPLIQYEDKTPVLIAILTWNWSPCNTYGIPLVYCRIDPFIKWINKQMKIN
ncbi:PREDICTED: trypsin-1-like isoform X2 [Ceratosolen solmsi marchali]|nr:PREDICTED: trypsin-1-like isoform X2 [Ceratosolen solmsi marchali]